MPGPWYVDFQNGQTTNSGLSALDPWKYAPGQAGASSQTNYGQLTAYDTIKIRKGTTSNLRLVVPLDGLTYTGYGDGAGNGINVSVPTNILGVYRDIPLDGFWTLDGTAIDDYGIFYTTVRNDITVEDIKVMGSQVGEVVRRHGIAVSGTGSNTNGFTLRRFHITSCTGRGIVMYSTNCLVEFGKIEYTGDDNITFGCSSFTSYRANTKDIVRYVELHEPNRINPGAGDTGDSGDFLQTIPSDGNYDGSLEFHHAKCRKSTQSKQAVVFHATHANSVFKLHHLDFDGGGDMQILTGHIKGKVYIHDVLTRNYVLENLPFLRFDPADVSPKSWYMDTGSELNIDNVHALGSSTAGFFRSTTSSSQGSYTMDGSINITNSSCFGQNFNSLSSAGTIVFTYPVNTTTPGPNFKAKVVGNLFPVHGNKPNIITPASADILVHSNLWGSGTYIHNNVAYSNLKEYNQASGNYVGQMPRINALLGNESIFNSTSILVHSF